ncbi:MAG: heme lyase CcmF/NrfE family subunit [Pseudomonadota bacterium]|nr:MAG: heme lyase CcmF/NrfE family subunit [Pseudomonadota bacterium]
MIPDIGHFALVLALALALVQAIFPLAGAQLGQAGWMAVARPAARAHFALATVALLCLAWAFLSDNFSVLYVANNSNTKMPTIYKISAVWGAHEGSLLLWVWILAVWTFAVTFFSRNLSEEYVARVIGVMGLTSIGFLLFTLLTSNPFQEVFPAPLEGRQLNPLLQDPGLAIHPPMLYTGYVGFSVAFAFAIAALLGGKLDASWARWSRPWTTTAWMFLTVGIALGSWWAYYELGWGGWWFWDPVENASFMPWLVGTALIHSLAVTEKRGTFKAWTVLLAIFTFSLSLLGTFLVRSGVLTSVHAFATDPERGLFILIFLAIVILGSLVLYAFRASDVRSTVSFNLLSRETLLLANNVLLVVAASAVLLGTVYPLVLDAISGAKISIGPPFFDLVFTVLMIPLVVLVGIGPLVRWKNHGGRELLRTLRVPIAVALVTLVVAIALLASDFSGSRLMTAVGVMLTAWVAISGVVTLRERLKHKGFSLKALAGAGVGFYGMWLAHLGVGAFIIGVTIVSSYSVEDDVRMRPGEVKELGGYSFKFEGVKQVPGPNYTAHQGAVIVSRGDDIVTALYPEKRTYLVQTMPMTEAAIDPGLRRDIYVSLGEPLDDGAWLIRLYYKPFQRWIWLGTILMALGGLLAASDRRYRLARKRETVRREDARGELLNELLDSGASAPASKG